MTVLLIILRALAVCAAGVALAQVFGRVQTAIRIKALDISDAHKQAALAYFFKSVDGQISIWRSLWDHIRAPFVLLIPLLKLPREADDLPDGLAYWRNDVSINGDGWGWFDPPTGKWHNDCNAEPPSNDVTPLSYSDPAYGGDAYYAPGHHPRSWYARWIWLAFRNVASRRMQDAGPLITQRPVLLAGGPLDGPSFALYWNGATGDDAAYQWHSINRWGPLLVWTNVGAKLGIPYTYPELLPCRAMLTGTWRAFRWAA